MSIKEMVAEGRKVRFMHYTRGELWNSTETGIERPAPTNDHDEWLNLTEHKAILSMRYIRKHLAYLEEAKRSHADGIAAS